MKPGLRELAEVATPSLVDALSKKMFSVSRCQACAKAFPVIGESSNFEQPDVTVVPTSLVPLWPVRYRAVAPEIPPSIRTALEDASAALGGGSVIGAMFAARTAVERALRHQKREREDLPHASLKALAEIGVISKITFYASDVARRVANYLGHEDPDPEREYTTGEAKELYTFVEELLDELYVKPARIAAHSAKVRGQEKQPDSEGESEENVNPPVN